MKMYTVQPGNRLTGKHRVYEAGENMPESELCGDWQGSIKDGVIVEMGAASGQDTVKAQEGKPAGSAQQGSEPSATGQTTEGAGAQPARGARKKGSGK